MKYNKLVRDEIPEYIRTKGGDPVFHVANETEYWEKLKEKLVEEANEFNKDENESELADILEVIDAVIEYKKFDRKNIDEVREKKSQERGRFKKQIILDES